MKKINERQQKAVKAGWTRCKICGTNVTGGFWTKYYHCVKHSWKAVMPVAELVKFCFGV